MPDLLRDRYLESLRDDPLTPQSRSQHRNVILAGSIGILVVQLNVVPTRISALGVDLETDDRHTIRVALLLSVIYFTVSFLVSAVGDVAAWRQAHEDARDARDTTLLNLKRFRRQLDEMRERDEASGQDIKPDMGATVADLLDAERRHTLYRVLVPTGAARAVIDFVIPVVVAVLAITMLATSL